MVTHRASVGGRHMVMPNSHCPPDTTRPSGLCRVRRCELSLAKSERSADRSLWSRSVQWRSLGLVICSSHHAQCVYILRGAQRRCVWVVWRLGLVARLACVAAAMTVRRTPMQTRHWTHLSSGRADSIHTATPNMKKPSCLCRAWRGATTNWVLAYRPLASSTASQLTTKPRPLSASSDTKTT